MENQEIQTQLLPAQVSGSKEKSQRPFRHKLLRFMGIITVIVIALELTLFNFSSYLLLGGKYTPASYSMEQLEVSGLQASGGQPGTYKAISQRPTIKISGIQSPVRTLYIDASTEKSSRYELFIDLNYTDTARAYNTGTSKTMKLTPGVERSQYTTCSFFGDTQSITMTLQVDIGEVLHINDITVNKSIPMGISFVRMLLLILSCTAVYVLLRAPSFRVAYQSDNPIHTNTILGSVWAFLVLLLVVYLMYGGLSTDTFKATSGDQISQELVDAFEHGQVSLLDTPSEGLLEMDNPYDHTARTALKVNAKWDHLLFNGKYYSYYGIAPVMLVFLPYHLLTGYYLPSHFACFLFVLIGALFAARVFIRIISTWMPKTPFRLVLCGLIMLLMSSGLLFCVYRPMFYETEEAAAFMFFVIGVDVLLTSGICTPKTIRLSRLAWSSVFASLSVLSRPTFALYAVALLCWLGYGMVQYRREHTTRGAVVRYLIASLLPYVVFGSLQMAYNYARFGSFFEFGIRYSLTINDFTHTQFYAGMSFVSVWNMLLAVPVVKSTFPFLTGNFDLWGVNGYYFSESYNTFGLLWRALPLLSFGYAPRLLRRCDKRQVVRSLLLCGLPGFIIPVFILLLTWESGYALRYNIDFAGQMVLAALVLIYTVYARMTNAGLKRVLDKVMIACTVWCVIGTMALVLQHVPGVTNTVFHNPDATILYYRFARLLQFWY